MARKLFVSYSVTGDSAGRHFVRRLLRRLGEQWIDAWIYESPGGRIRSADSISQACRRKIEESELFVVVVNDVALSSDYVAMEVSHALWLRQSRELPIYPILATSRPRSFWPPHIVEALGFKGAQVALDDDAVDHCVFDLCVVLGLDYRPPQPTDPRLPLAKRVADEIAQHRSMTDYDVDDFRKLMKRCELACELLQKGDFERAEARANGILADLEDDYGIARPYYPRVFKGAILLHKAAASRLPHEDAFDFFDALVVEGHELLDANAFAGRAHALLSLRRYAEAAEDYRRAEARLDRPDPALLYSIARVQLLAGTPPSEDDLCRWQSDIADGLVTTQPGDLSRIASVVALGHARRGEADRAEAAWKAVAEPDEVFPEILAETCHWLRHAAHETWDDSPLMVASRLLDGHPASAFAGDEPPSLALAHVRARIFFDLGRSKAARADMDELIRRCPRNPLYLLDAAMFALGDGDRLSASRLCAAAMEIVDHSACWPPLTAQEFNYVLGQAAWLLGQEDTARESFRRSARPREDWYKRSMPAHFGAAGSRRASATRP